MSDSTPPTAERYVTPEHAGRFSLYRLCECPECEGRGKLPLTLDFDKGEVRGKSTCVECRGEGRVRQEVATAGTPEAVGVALVTLGREHEWEGCAFGLLDREPECETCGGAGVESFRHAYPDQPGAVCHDCKGSGVKPTGTWLVRPWLPSARNVTEAARTLARSKKTDRTQ